MIGCPRIFVSLAMVVGLTGIWPATAQQIVGGIGQPNVVVDYGVLDQLGPPPNIPSLVLGSIGRRLTGRVGVTGPGTTRPGILGTPPPRFPIISNGVRGAEQKRIVLRPPGTWKKQGVKRKRRIAARKTVTPRPVRETAKKPAASPAPSMPRVAALPKVEALPKAAPPPPVIKTMPLPAPPVAKTPPPAKPAPPKQRQSARVPPPPVALTPAPAVPPPPPTISAAPPVAPPPAITPPPPPQVPGLAVSPAPSQPPQRMAKAVAKTKKPEPRMLGAGSSVRIIFSTGSAKLDKTASVKLNRVASALNADATLRVQLEAYANAAQGSVSQARRLSLSRALAARSFLIGKKVRSTRIDVRALGNKFGDEAADRIDIIVKNR